MARPGPPLGPLEQRVQPGDSELDVVGVGSTQPADPVGQPPQGIVAGQALRDPGDERLDIGVVERAVVAVD